MLPMNKKNSEYFKFHYSERISIFGKGTRKYISFNLLTWNNLTIELYCIGDYLDLRITESQKRF
jgi:hypothetical protein